MPTRNITRAVRAILCSSAAILLVACSSAAGPAGPNLTGHWVGSGGNEDFDFNLNDADGKLVGSGGIHTPTWAAYVSVSGTRSGTAVSLTFTSSGYIPGRFVGVAVSASHLAGHIYDSGFNGDSMVVDKR